MKAVYRIVIVALLVALALPVISASAQDGEEVVSIESSAVYFLEASSGSFADNGDGTYALALEGVGEDIVWIMSQPVLSVATLNNANLSAHWASNAELVADAVLEVEDLNVALTLTSPVLDAGTVTFVATVEEIISFGDAKEPELPMSFDAANLSIAWTLDFQDGLVVGIQAMYEGVRATPEECSAAQTEWADFLSWAQSIQGEYTRAYMTCYGYDGTTDAGTKQAACDRMKEISAEQQTRNADAAAAHNLINTECN